MIPILKCALLYLENNVKTIWRLNKACHYTKQISFYDDIDPCMQEENMDIFVLKIKIKTQVQRNYLWSKKYPGFVCFSKYYRGI